MPGYLSLQEAVARLGVNRRTLTRWCAQGLVEGAEKLGVGRGTWMIPEATIEKGITPPRRGGARK